MFIDLGPVANPDSLSAALWIGALLVATSGACDVFPDELAELAAEYFSRFPPLAKA
jgi:hypothetical protein